MPTVVRFELEEIRSINLDKSGAVVSGFFFVEIHYNSEIKHLIETTKRKLREKEAKAKKALKEAKSTKDTN